jgi:hypothetical protein
MDEAGSGAGGAIIAQKATHTWKPGSIKQGNSPPRYAPKGDAGTKSPEAYEPEGKYGKPGGRGQRSGA